MSVHIDITYRFLILTFAVFLCYEPAIAHEWMAPEELSKVKNPVPFDEASATRGKEIYLDNCAACHGDDSKGLKAQDVNLVKDPPNLQKRLATHSDGDFFWKIQIGRGEMPSFKENLEKRDIWDVINWLKTTE